MGGPARREQDCQAPRHRVELMDDRERARVLPVQGAQVVHELGPKNLQQQEGTMAQDSTRRLLKVFGIAVTNLEDALEAALAEGAKKAEAELRERMKEVIALVERLSERAAKL